MLGIPACPKGMAWPTHFSCLCLFIYFTGEDLLVPGGQTGHGVQGPGQVSFPMICQLLDPPETLSSAFVRSPKGTWPQQGRESSLWTRATLEQTQGLSPF